MNNILVIGAHFDDAELAVGGSMAKWVKNGKNVYKMTLTDNNTVFEKKDINVNYLDSFSESANACSILGVKEVFVPVEKCTELYFNKNQMQFIEDFIISNNIDTVIFHYMFDMQQDHVHASTISYVAGRYCKNLLAYQSNKYILPEDFYPRLFIDITDTIKLKEKALNSYSSDHNRNNQLFNLTIKQNEVWGYQSNLSPSVTYAEAFHVIKMSI
jgi:LmbE family N-acetylglucosaminyl deacetylase